MTVFLRAPITQMIIFNQGTVSNSWEQISGVNENKSAQNYD